MLDCPELFAPGFMPPPPLFLSLHCQETKNGNASCSRGTELLAQGYVV